MNVDYDLGSSYFFEIPWTDNEFNYDKFIITDYTIISKYN